MSAHSLAQSVGAKIGDPGVRAKSLAGDQAKSLAEHVMAYIPSDVIALFIPISVGIAASTLFTADLRFWVVVALGLITAAYIASTGITEARKTQPEIPAGGLITLAITKGWFEILGGFAAAFVWGAALPSSWFTYPEAWMPGALLAVVAAILGILARFFAALPTKA